MFRSAPTQTLRILQPYMDFIRLGVKGVEGRINCPDRQRLQPGEMVCLRACDDAILCQVQHLPPYPDFAAMLEGEEVRNLLPQFSVRHRARLVQLGHAGLLEPFSFDESWDIQRRIDEGVKIYHAFPGSSRVRVMGAVAIGLRYLEDYSHCLKR